jgi:D-3-phosphoglycerate dehydrogenase
MTRVLLTTTSFQDTPGEHQEILTQSELEFVKVRGPLSEEAMLSLEGEFDAFLCGDDAITPRVIDKFRPRLKIIAKYGIGVDKIDVDYATAQNIPVFFTPGVNHTTVAEHTFGLMLCLTKHFPEEIAATRAGKWTRITGNELYGKRLGILGLGRIGKEVAIRARAFGMPVVAYDLYFDEAFASAHGIEKADSIEAVMKQSDVLSLHLFLTPETHNLVNDERLALLPSGALIINCARGELVDGGAVARALRENRLGGYGADVLDQEPPPPDHPLLSAPRCVITPHVGSRTYESVVRQGTMAIKNLILGLAGKPPLAQVNKVPIPSSDLADDLAAKFPWIS